MAWRMLCPHCHLPIPDARILRAAGSIQRRLEKIAQRKLDSDAVCWMMRRVADGAPKSVIAKELGVSRETLYRELREVKAGMAGAEEEAGEAVVKAVKEEARKAKRKAEGRGKRGTKFQKMTKRERESLGI